MDLNGYFYIKKMVKTLVDYLKYLMINKGKLLFLLIANLFVGYSMYIIATNSFEEHYYKCLIGILAIIIGIVANIHPFVEFESSNLTKK